jgi:3-methyladenine DNA glycosylase AlkD
VARELWGSRRPDERALAVHYLAQFHRRFQAASWGEFKRWLAEARSTAELDLVATRLTGTLVQKDRAWCRVLGNWALSRSARERRAAAMALVPRARRMGDAEAALALCEGLMRDRSPLVREGVEALLREARAADPALAADFLSRWNRSAGW